MSEPTETDRDEARQFWARFNLSSLGMFSREPVEWLAESFAEARERAKPMPTPTQEAEATATWERICAANSPSDRFNVRLSEEVIAEEFARIRRETRAETDEIKRRAALLKFQVQYACDQMRTMNASEEGKAAFLTLARHLDMLRAIVDDMPSCDPEMGAEVVAYVEGYQSERQRLAEENASLREV